MKWEHKPLKLFTMWHHIIPLCTVRELCGSLECFKSWTTLPNFRQCEQKKLVFTKKIYCRNFCPWIWTYCLLYANGLHLSLFFCTRSTPSRLFRVCGCLVLLYPVQGTHAMKCNSALWSSYRKCSVKFYPLTREIIMLFTSTLGL